MKNIFNFLIGKNINYGNNSDIISSDVFIRASNSLARMRMVFLFSLLPSMILIIYNIGFSINKKLIDVNLDLLSNWHYTLLKLFKLFPDPTSFFASFSHGLIIFLPILISSYLIALFWECLFSIIRKKSISQNLFQYVLLFSLLVPISISLLQIAIGITGAVLVGKELLGGRGKTLFHISLLGIIFIFIAGSFNFNWGLDLSVIDPYNEIITSITFFDLYNINTIITSIFAMIVLGYFGIISFRLVISVIISAVFSIFVLSFFSITTLSLDLFLSLAPLLFVTIFYASDYTISPISSIGKIYYGSLIGILYVVVDNIFKDTPWVIFLVILIANFFTPFIDYILITIKINRMKVNDKCYSKN